MNEQREKIKQQLDELHAEADSLQDEEKRAHAHLAVMWKEQEAAMKAYRSILLRQQQIETQIKKLLAKDTRLYQKAKRS